MPSNLSVEVMQQWCASQAERSSDAIALVMSHQRMTYGQLEALSNQLARLLVEGGCQRGDRVAVLLPKSPLAIVAFLGILKADCIYVPLDASSPPHRLANMIGRCEPKWLLASASQEAILRETLPHVESQKPIPVGWMDGEPEPDSEFAGFRWKDILRFSDRPLPYHGKRDDPAYILFTSGSTGQPKGVVITHSSVIHFIDWAVRYFNITPDDRLSGHAPLYFDLSMLDIFGTLASGAQLHMIPPEMNLLPHKLAEFIRASCLTQWFSVPSVLRYLARFDVIRQDDFPALKRIMWCGEVLPTPALIHLMQRLPKVSFTNLYGPTEATVASSYYTVSGCPEGDAQEIPIGAACDGEELLILDDELQPVPTGEVGNLYIEGVGLSQGYWREPEKTESAFISVPFSRGRIYRTGDLARLERDGLVYFHGRADTQVKSRGYRIELMEIESALNRSAYLKECAVVAVDTDEFEGKELCAAYVPAEGRQGMPSILRKELLRILPSYMIPSRWMAFESLPFNANGKIDRQVLRERFSNGRK